MQSKLLDMEPKTDKTIGWSTTLGMIAGVITEPLKLPLENAVLIANAMPVLHELELNLIDYFFYIFFFQIFSD